VFKNCLSKKTIIFTSKNDRYIQYCDEFGYIKNGLIIERGTNKEAGTKLQGLRDTFNNKSVLTRETTSIKEDQNNDIYNRLRDKNAKNIKSEFENYENLVKSTKEFVNFAPPKFGIFFIKNKSSSFKIVIALLLYTIAGISQFGSVVFLHYIGWHDIHEGVFEIKGKLLKCLIFVSCILVSYLMYCCSAYILNFSLGNQMFNFFTELMIQRLLSADVYKILHNTVSSLYRTNIAGNLKELNTNIPKMIDCLGYNLSLAIAFFAILSIFISPVFIILSIVYFVFVILIWRSNRKDLEQIKDIDSFLKIKFNQVLDDIIKGIN
jgi:hypothetical protein